jgi:choice-of-anchor C domain-containing protein
VKGQCVTDSGLAFGRYYYDQEQTTSGATWATPLYDDQNSGPASSLSDLHTFNAALDPANDNFDGVINISSVTPSRTLLVLNKLTDACPNLPDNQNFGANCNPTSTTATINATKIVCPVESDLPNWGDHQTTTSITATTATTFLAAHTDCHTADWTFEWAPSSASNPGDNIQAGGGVWTPFTGGTVTIPVPSNPAYVWVREQMPTGYIPFSGDITNNTNNVSAEMYCNIDVLHYDNYDRVDNMVAGNTYNCVGFNVPTTPPATCEAGVNLLQNPSFENPTVTNSALWDIFPQGTPTLGWLAKWINPSGAPAIANVEIQKNGLGGDWTASAGTQWTELDSDFDGPSGSITGEAGAVAISQDIATINGDNYTVAFDFSARPGTVAAENKVEVLANNVVIGSVGPTAGTGTTAWTNHSFNFNATGALTTITFRDAGTPNDSLGTFIDNTSVMCQPKQGSPDVTVTVEKFIDTGVQAPLLTQATSGNTNSSTFNLTSTWTAANLNGGVQTSGDFALGPVTYTATTSDMTSGAAYSVVENNEGSSCNANNQGQYILEGYKVGDTESLALASATIPAASFTNITTNKFVIVVNRLCGEVLGDQTVQVHVYKYLPLDYSVVPVQVPDNSTAGPFPMTSTTTASNINGGNPSTGTYDLGSHFGGAALKYQADTAAMASGANYTTSEVADGSVVVFSLQECSSGKYYLVGYKSSTVSLADANTQSATTTPPAFTNLQSDAYVIVVNNPCPPPTQPTCPATDTGTPSGIRFETSQGYTTGSVNGQNGWSATGPYDQAIVTQSTYPTRFENQSLRISDATASGSFGDWVFAKPITNSAGESTTVGATQSHFEAQFDIASTLPCQQQPGLYISVSPDRGDGSRMSYLRFEDQSNGMHVFFDDVTDAGPVGTVATFNESDIATLQRDIPHTIKFVMDFVDGPSNDVVQIYIDGALIHTGTSWENYYRYDSEASAEQAPRAVKTLIFQARGSSTPADLGHGYLFDNVNLSSSVPIQQACNEGDELVLNGSFENGVDAGSFVTVNAVDSSSIANWTVGSGSVDYIGSYWPASAGSRSVDLNGNTTGSISQTLTTVVGQTYTVSFDMSGNPDNSNDANTSPSNKVMKVFTDGTASPENFSYDTAVHGNSLSNMKWSHGSYSFTASATSTVLTFASQIEGAYGPVIDNVSTTCTNGPTTGTLVVKKVVTNDNGGIKTAGDFSFEIDNGSLISFNTNGENDITAAPGTYSVTEPDSTHAGYTATLSDSGEDAKDCSNITIVAGQTSTCTITNNDIAQQGGGPTTGDIVVKKVTNVGTEQSFGFVTTGTGYVSFDLTNGGSNDQSLAPGDYTVSEASTSGWTSDGGVCDHGTPGSITLTAGEIVTCTFTNTQTITPDIGGGGGGGGGGGSSFQPSTNSGGGRIIHPLGQVLGAQTSCGIYIDKFLRKGYRHNDVNAVKELQQFLNDYMNAGLTVNGNFGASTEAAVKAFQLAHKDKIMDPWHLKLPTGIFYLTTQTEVNNIMCPSLNLPIPSPLIPFNKHPDTPKS